MPSCRPRSIVPTTLRSVRPSPHGAEGAKARSIMQAFVRLILCSGIVAMLGSSACIIHLSGPSDGAVVASDARGDRGDTGPPVGEPCMVDCTRNCTSRTGSCGNNTCLYWMCQAACGSSGGFCCITPTTITTVNDSANCPTNTTNRLVCPGGGGPLCGQRASGCNCVTSGSPYCCRGVCGSSALTCSARSSCCVDSCGTTSGGTVGQLCNGACSDTQTDTSNCGACGNQCIGTARCVAGRCTCTTGRTHCSGSGCVGHADRQRSLRRL
jgi:hypothetical protein